MTSVTCGLTAKKPGTAPCPTLVIEYGTTSPFIIVPAKASWASLICRTHQHYRRQWLSETERAIFRWSRCRKVHRFRRHIWLWTTVILPPHPSWRGSKPSLSIHKRHRESVCADVKIHENHVWISYFHFHAKRAQWLPSRRTHADESIVS